MENQSEIKEQIENYNSLKWDKTYRGQTMLLLWMLSVVIIGLSFLNKGPLTSFILDTGFTILMVLLIFIPLSWLIYKGKVWAIIICHILLVLSVIRETLAYLANTNFRSPVVVLAVGFLIYYIVMTSLVRSYRIEKLRRK